MGFLNQPLPSRIIGALVFFLIPQFAISQDKETNPSSTVKQPTYTTSRLATEKPVIDGKLDDECWKQGTWAGDYTQFIPNEGAKPTWPTALNIQYDDKNLYIAFRAYDGEPEKIHRLAGVRDEIVGDMVGITFDSYRDYRTGFEFTVTAWGQKVDLVLFNPMDWDFNWDAVWKVKVGKEDSAWVAEYEVPLSQLRYSGQEEQVWGMHTWRWISRLQEESNWEKQSKTGPGMLYNFGELRGIKGLKKSRRLEIMPFALGDLRTMQEEPGNPFTKNGRQWAGNLGLDAKIGISSNFTIDLTINPDFGQVESDPSVMNLTAFETFYEEKRPFFLEGLTIFDYSFGDQTLFYSRRIGHNPSLAPEPESDLFIEVPDKTTILGAAKLSGTTSKGLSVGFIQSVTANEFARFSDGNGNKSSQKIEPLTSYMVARVQKGYNAGNTVIGGMITSVIRSVDEPSLEVLSKNALTGGFDVLHHWKDKEFYFQGRILGSHVNGDPKAIRLLQESSARYFQRPGADYLSYDTTRTSLSGFGGNLKIGKGSKGFWRYSTGVTWLSPGLEFNDLGFMQSADDIQNENEISYFVNQPVSIFRTYQVTLEQFNNWNFSGTFLGTGGHLAFNSEFKNQWSSDANFIFYSGAIDPRILRGGPELRMPGGMMTFGGVKTDQAKKIAATLEGSFEKSGESCLTNWNIEPGLILRPISILRIRFSADYSENRNKLQYVSAVNYLSQKQYLLGSIDQKTLGLTFRADLNLSPEFSVQYYGSPYISRGTYSAYKRITNPGSKSFEKRFITLSDPILTNSGLGFDENRDKVPDYWVDHPDFNFHQFRSNLVAKWEFRPGSFIYLVWSGDRTGRNADSRASFGDSYGFLGDVTPKNVFLVKVNYWFSL